MRWTKLFLVIANLSLLLTLAICAPEARGESCVRSHEINKGIEAPCDGVLWPKNWSIQAVTCVEVDLPEAIEKEQRALADAADCAVTLSRLQEAYEANIINLERIARDAAGLESQWYESPVLWLSVGLVGGAAVAFAVSE